MSSEKSGIKMIDVGQKPDVQRTATAKGEIRLKPSTIELIKKGKTKKGDVLSAAQLAAIMAVKKTPEFIPLCHPIPITRVDVDFEIEEGRVTCHCSVCAHYKTGVEMEALCGVTAALLTIWDMTKYLEKDENGQYPTTRIESIEVVEKVKGSE